jgi:hypothetical protein
LDIHFVLEFGFLAGFSFRSRPELDWDLSYVLTRALDLHFVFGLWLGFGPAFGFGFQMHCHSEYLSWALQWSQWGNTSWTRSSLAIWDICRGPYRGLKGALSLGGVVTMRVWA